MDDGSAIGPKDIFKDAWSMLNGLRRLGGAPRAGLFLFLLSLISLGAFIPWLGLIGDDWWFFAHLSDGQFPTAQLNENPARPMVAFIWMALWSVLGLHVWVYYVVNLVVQWLSGLLFFLILRRIWNAGPALAAAALFLLYPADTAHVYLSSISTRFGMLLALAGALLWLGAAERRRWLQAFGLAAMALSLLSYETFLPLLALMPLALLRREWHQKASWLRRAVPVYSILGLYLAFRLLVAYAVSQRTTEYYASIRLAPEWIWSQLLALPAATTWNGWLYSLKGMFDFGLIPTGLLFILALTGALIGMLWVGDGRAAEPLNRRVELERIGIGAILSVVAVLPVVASNFSLEHAVGTLDGRLLHAAGLGHAILVVGSCGLAASLSPSRSGLRPAIRNILMATLVAIGLIGNLALQRDYARAWQSQLAILRQLSQQAAALRDGTGIALLDIPSGAFDNRFYYPSTQLIRRFYSNPTLHGLPWQAGFPPQEQTVAFGEQTTVSAANLVTMQVIEVDNSRMVAFRLDPSGNLVPLSQIANEYLCRGTCEELPMSPPPGWRPAQSPVAVSSVAEVGLDEDPHETAWRRWLLESVHASARFPLP